MVGDTLIRQAAITDLDTLAGMFNDYRIFYDKESDLAGSKTFLSQRIGRNESVIFISNHQGEDAGFVQLYPLFSSTNMGPIWLLNDLFVGHPFRGLGISKILMAAAKQHARDTGAIGISLETSKTNFIGNQLYPKVGFILDDEHNYYYWETAAL